MKPFIEQKECASNIPANMVRKGLLDEDIDTTFMLAPMKVDWLQYDNQAALYVEQNKLE